MRIQCFSILLCRMRTTEYGYHQKHILHFSTDVVWVGVLKVCMPKKYRVKINKGVTSPISNDV